MAALLVKPDYGPVVGAGEDRKELHDQEVDLINIGVAWTSEHPETCRTAELIVMEEGVKLADCPVD